MILPPIGKLYGLAMKVRNSLYDRGIFRSHSLGARTISVGNLTTGGTGKTPLVALISEILSDAGETVCILTRGYGRRNPNERVIVSDGSGVLVDAAEGGDEPVELAIRLAGRAIVVADADRLSAGTWAKGRFGVTAFVLDDGFQHRRVKRDLDVVCVDATSPCGNGRVLPAGSLRESFNGLDRADIIVLTRTDLAEDVTAIEQRLRKWNKRAPIFRSRTRISELVSLTGSSGDLQSVNSGAFCALGNPDAFFQTLERCFPASGDIQIVFTTSFPDHHSYKQTDIDELELQAKAGGAEILITTAKDAVKLKHLQFTMPCYVAESDTLVDDMDGLRKQILASM